MPNAAKALAALAAVTLALVTTAPAQAAIICDEDGCRPALIISHPIVLGDDDCGCSAD